MSGPVDLMSRILFEDGEALVIDKPGGLPIERPRKGGASLEDHLEALKLGFQRPPAPAHRIDTDTSGCLLLARTGSVEDRHRGLALFAVRMDAPGLRVKPIRQMDGE